MDEKEIIDLYWNRSEDAITETDALFGRRLRRLANRILQDQENAEESVNDTYLKTWNSIPKARPQYLYAYISAICRHVCLDLLDWKQAEKRNAEIVAITDEIELCIPDSQEENRLQSKQIAEAMDVFLESLPEQSRLIFLRRYWYADSVADIARRYSLTESKVKMQLLRTRGKLKDYLEKEGIQI